MLPEELKKKIQNGGCDEMLKRVYGCGEDVTRQGKRLIKLLGEFENRFGNEHDVMIFSAPGRTEIGGNHTDHQGGCVLAAGVSLDAVAVAAKTGGCTICVKSEGFPEDSLSTEGFGKKPEEAGTSKALIRGLCSGFSSRGYHIGGFCAFTASDVLAGSGLSSSAAFEVLIGNVINSFFCNNEVPPLEIAKLGQYAENEYFGKPCGLMDQAASALGGFSMIDFSDPRNPRAEKIPFDFSKCGYRLCMIETKGNHADLTPDYAAIPAEMKSVASFFGREVLSKVDENEFYSHIPGVRAAAGDRAVLRAIHFFAENRRVTEEAEALKRNDFQAFLRLVNESGRSSFQYLQNVYSPTHISEQGVSVALALCERLLSHRGGAWRVHGGGFAGTVQAYVPNDFLPEFTGKIESVFGKGTCRPLSIRPAGGTPLLFL